MRKKIDTGWQFFRAKPDTPRGAVAETDWQPVSLPHDWLIGQEEDLYETGDGLYRRVLTCGPGEEENAWILRFDGVYMDCAVSLNGEAVCEHHYGYTAFEADLTGRIRPGDNLLTVRVRHRSPNSRWYSGAGIFRDVFLFKHCEGFLVEDGLYAVPRKEKNAWWTVTVTAEAERAEGEPVRFVLERAGTVAAEAEGPVINGTAKAEMRVLSPRCWSPEDPALYSLTVSLPGDSLTRNIGFRETVFDPERGLLLNGEVTKLKGVCLHHDLGLLGSAFHEKAARRQLQTMLDMGVNALRTSHNPPASRLLDLCDALGLLVVDEFTDMWQMPKTTYDYARFFDADVAADVASWVRRDRNHPCVIMWSVGNEIYDTHANPKAPEITAMLKGLVEKHDPAKNAMATIGSNYMPWAGAQKCADVLKIAGYNYGEKCYAEHHAQHPDWVIYGSETASLVHSRGVYHFPMRANVLAEEDLQCSALGNSYTSWGTQNIAALLADDLNNPFSMGQFIWSGIDYIGEPTPYHTRNSYFGMADTACFPKDIYYQFAAAWSEKPMCHIGVTWDWNEGQLIDVPVMTSCASAELFLNGVSLGRKDVDQRDAAKARPVWQVPFTPGILQVKGCDEDGHVRAQHTRCTSGDPARLVLTCPDTRLAADGRDLAFITVSAVDAQGLPVENACDRVRIRVEGPAFLLGLDNGDSTDRDGYRQDSRRLFNGLLLAMVGYAREPGMIRVIAEAEGLETACLTLSASEASDVEETVPPHIREIPLNGRREKRRIDLKALGSTELTPEHPSVDFAVTVCPEGAAEEAVRWRIVNEAGITSPIARVTEIPGGVRVTGLGDGDAWLRGTLTNGTDCVRVISHMELRLSGFGAVNLDPYGFVTAGLYDLHRGNITAGNEQGISFSREAASMVGFSNVDFGPVGSDEITLPVFALNGDRYDIRLWLGDPENGGEELAVLSYQKPSVWNTYQAETWKLPRRITGLQTICFTLNDKVHLKGFSFRRLERAWLNLSALEADSVYGDDFRRTDRGVEGIGNNVSLAYGGMDFDQGGPVTLTLHGRTDLPVCSVSLRITDAAGETSAQLCGFRSDAGERQTFALTVPAGVCRVAFVFLPGSRFDFYDFQFSREG